ncbi:MAG: dihydrofolate reductase [Rhodoferax sp.]|uniref:dihydrofolate reductase n=1 Tax=Rhodoferax sp. TaxID=50421 RepID=UPI0014002B4A|nr:dihydrofolate reductase [Rhodoferax sp.]NDP38923.1 dihydrofolate reductase [Rhodoferax sp.]
MKLNLILARARNGVIGVNGQLPWRLPEDMAHFKRATMGSPVIMGRKTWESLPPKFRPLPGRLNIVVTRQAAWQAEGALVAQGLPEACALCPPESTAWVIGGAELYAQALVLADAALVTEIEADFEGDALAPAFGPEWVQGARERQVAASGLHFSFVTYHRRSAALQV